MKFPIPEYLIEGAYKLALDRYRTTKDRAKSPERDFGERWDHIAQGEVGALVIARHLRKLGFLIRANRNIEYIKTGKGLVSTDGEVDLCVSLDGVAWITMSIKVSTWPCRGDVPYTYDDILNRCDFKVFSHKNLEDDFRADVLIQAYFPAHTKAKNHLVKEDWAKVTDWLNDHPEPTPDDLRQALTLVRAKDRYTELELFGFTTAQKVLQIYRDTPPPCFHELLPMESSNGNGRDNPKYIWWMRIGACRFMPDTLKDVLTEMLQRKVANGL